MTDAGTHARTFSLPRAFRYVAVVETLSWLALIVATVVKYSADEPGPVHVLGPIHGLLFMAYVGLVFAIRSEMRWTWGTTVVVLLESLLPGGGFLVARRRDLRDR